MNKMGMRQILEELEVEKEDELKAEYFNDIFSMLSSSFSHLDVDTIKQICPNKELADAINDFDVDLALKLFKKEDDEESEDEE